MAYIPKTEEELARELLLPEGEYDFEVIDALDKPSKKGNDMFTLKLQIFDSGGMPNYVWDYLVIGNNFGERKLRHVAISCGLAEIYSSGKLTAEDFVGKSGKAIIKIAPGNDQYPDPKNTVFDYLPPDGFKAKSEATDIDLNDSIPF
jgi:hypothetical protein